MKQKVRKISVKTKILLPVSIAIILLCLILGVTSYRHTKEGMVEMGVEEAEMAANVAVKVIDGDLVSVLEPGCENTEGYRTLLNTMRDIQEDCGIAFLYTLYTDGKQVYYGVDTDDTSGQHEVGDAFEVPYKELADVFAGSSYVQDYIDSTEDGDLISVYKPIRDSAGNPVGILGCDYDASSVVGRLSTILVQVVGISAVCLAAALVILGLVVGSIMRSLRRVDGKVYDMVHSEGDLTQKLDVRSGDEMELIAGNVNALLEHIRQIMLNIAGNSKQLNISSKSVVQSISGAEVSITEVSATMEEMSAAMEETSASLSQIQESINDVYRAIEHISSNANAGKKSSDETMAKAAQIYVKAEEEQTRAKGLAQDMAVSVNEKIEKSRAVEEISGLTANIINIADQTNLLSLNASIEAARAGEAGKGFSVVASEIAKLASDTTAAASRIQDVSDDVITAVNELAEKAEAMLNFLDETAMRGYERLMETSGNYRDDVGDMNSMMQEFANESEQLRNNIDDIKEAINAVNLAVAESAKGIVNVAENSVELTSGMRSIGEEAHSNMHIAEQLDQEVNKFKLE